MKKIKAFNTLLQNWKWVLFSLLSGNLVFFLFSFYFVQILSEKIILTGAIATFLFFIVIDTKIKDIYKRYVRNYLLEKAPFTILDGLFIVILSFAFTSYLFQNISSLKDSSLASIMSNDKSYQFSFILLSIVEIYFIYVMIFARIQLTKKQKDNQNNNQTAQDLLDDEPITKVEDDLLDRGGFIDSLYKRISNLPLDDSFVFGLYGTWGEGKTSTINLLLNHFIENDKFLVYKFNPWHFLSDEALVKSFYEGLYSEINNYFCMPNAKKLFTRYHKVLVQGLKLTGVNINLDAKSVTTEELKKDIHNLILKTQKKILIVIDDIDRLFDADSVMQIFRIVKLSGNFRNTIYLLAFDVNAIGSILKNKGIGNELLYLEKIVQAPIHLPGTDQAAIDRYLFFSEPEEIHYSQIDKLIKHMGINVDEISNFNEEIKSIYFSLLRRFFPTLRQAKKYINGLYSTLPAIKNEVNLIDFLILEIFRVFCPRVYDDIWKNPHFYIGTRLVTHLSYTVYQNIALSRENSERWKQHIEHINSVLEGHEKKEELKDLLAELFEDVSTAYGKMRTSGRDERAEKRINHPDVFPKYFIGKIPYKDISDAEIEEFIANTNNLVEESDDGIEGKIDEVLLKYRNKNQLGELFDLVEEFVNKFTEDAAKFMIKFLSEKAKGYSTKTLNQILGSDFKRAVSLIKKLHEVCIINKDDAKNQFDKTINETPSFAVAAVLIYEGRPSNIRFSVEEEMSLRERFKGKLQKYFIDGKRDIYSEEGQMATYIIQRVSSNLNVRYFNDYLFNLFEKNPHYIGIFIKYFLNLDEFNIQVMKDVIDIERLKENIELSGVKAYSEDLEKKAIDKFEEQYQKLGFEKE